MNLKNIILVGALLALTNNVVLASSTVATEHVYDPILVTVGHSKITQSGLEKAMLSSPYGTQFSALDEDEQAKYRGDILLRMVNQEILRQEAKDLKIDELQDYKFEVINYRTGLLYRKFIESIHDSIKIPKKLDKAYKDAYKTKRDALAAARSTYIASQYKKAKKDAFINKGNEYHIKVFPERLNADAKDDTLLVSSDKFKIYYRDVKPPVTEHSTEDAIKYSKDKLDEVVEIMIGAYAAAEQGIDVEDQVNDYKNNLLVRVLIKKKEKEWLKDYSVLENFYKNHQEIGYIPERRQVGQIVLKTRKEAEKILKRIKSGESLYVLARQYSIDPEGKKLAGDMGWVFENSSYPQIEKALKTLKDNEISDIIETPLGFHIVTIQERKPSKQKSLADIKDRVEQEYLAEKSADYIKSLLTKFPIKWSIPTAAK